MKREKRLDGLYRVICASTMYARAGAQRLLPFRVGRWGAINHYTAVLTDGEGERKSEVAQMSSEVEPSH